jgi:hypothetical protein
MLSSITITNLNNDNKNHIFPSLSYSTIILHLYTLHRAPTYFLGALIPYSMDEMREPCQYFLDEICKINKILQPMKDLDANLDQSGN